MIDHGTGTILHPQKVKKERLPLAELLTGLPKYSSGSAAAAAAAEKEKKVILRNEDVLSRSTRNARGRPMTTYETGAQEAMFKPPPTANYRHLEGQQPPAPPPPPPPPMTSSSSDMMRSEAARRGLASTPSENSIDDSVKSAQAIGKEVLEKYLEKLKTASAATGAAAPGTSGHFWYQQSGDDVFAGKEHHATSATAASAAAAAAAGMNLVRPSASGFSPYYSIPPQHPHQGTGARGGATHSSPRFSSPPPSTHDVMMMSPIGDFRGSENR